MKKLLLALGLCVMVTAFAFAADSVTLEFWDHMIDKVGTAFVADFQAKYPNITIKRTYYGDPAINDALFVAAATGTGPDVFYDWSGYTLWPLVDGGLAMDLTKYMAQYQWDKKIQKGALDLARYKGGIWGMPFAYSTMPLQARKDMLNKYNNGKIPTSMAEFTAWGDRMAKDGIALICTAGVDGWHFMRIVQMIIENFTGPAYFDKLMNNEATWNAQKVYDAFAEVKKWADKGYFQPGFLGIKPGEAKIALYGGKAACSIEPQSFEANLKNDGGNPDDYVAFAFPIDSRPQRAESYITIMGASAKGKHPDEAVKWLDYCSSLETQTKFKDLINWNPACIGYQIPAAQKLVIAMNKIAATLGAQTMMDQGLPFEVVGKEFEAQEKIVLGQITPQQAADMIQKSYDAYQVAHPPKK
jgi:raffinose/stachyose/melibiose transport system substrate-binding protein